jgi:hypothetical protein
MASGLAVFLSAEKVENKHDKQEKHQASASRTARASLVLNCDIANLLRGADRVGRFDRFRLHILDVFVVSVHRDVHSSMVANRTGWMHEINIR